MKNPKPTNDSADAILSEPPAKVSRSLAVVGRSRELAAAAARTAIANNGSDVLVLDVCEQTALFDYFVIATGTSRRQLHAISEEIDDVLQKELGDSRLGIEGYEDSRWIVLDYGSVMIHLFDEEARAYYDLESLWADAKVVPLTDLGLSDAELSPRPKT
jgi:ribosome-associated protein